MPSKKSEPKTSSTQTSASNHKPTEKANVPKGRLARLGKIGAMATQVAGNMLGEGLSQLAKGERPKVKDLLFTPSNAMRIADQLAQLRGAAMKVGQLISMDAGDLLPPELADILARLRSDAKAMPKAELFAVLTEKWGENWRNQFIQFDIEPIAAASIGQVHKAISKDLERMAVKIQYPGVQQSIDSDVDNVVLLIKMTGLLPKSLDLKPLLTEAKKQLHDEADYLKEAASLSAYRKCLASTQHFDDQFLIPEVISHYTSDNILAMTFVDGMSIEQLCQSEYPQSLRNKVIENLFALMFKELFEFRLVQTDPNFANYQYNQEEDKIVLLDFGATRVYNEEMCEQYRQLASAAIQDDIKGVHRTALALGLINTNLSADVQAIVTDLCIQACEPLKEDSEYDFASSDLAKRMQDQGMQLGLGKGYAHTPQANSIFLHRKLGGLFLLAVKLKAKVNLHRLFTPYLKKRNRVSQLSQR